MIKPYQRRVSIERVDLNDKVEKLSKFLDTEEYEALPETDRGLLVRQLGIMNDYRDVLDQRIARFT